MLVLLSSVCEHVSAGKDGAGASSRNIGRHLAGKGLHAVLKARFAGLYHFLQQHPECFRIEVPTTTGVLEYQVHLLPGWQGHVPQRPADSEELASTQASTRVDAPSAKGRPRQARL